MTMIDKEECQTPRKMTIMTKSVSSHFAVSRFLGLGLGLGVRVRIRVRLKIMG